MKSPGLAEGSPLSIGMYTPSWPSDAFPNGIIPYVEILAGRFEAMGHRVTILTRNIAGEPSAPNLRVVSRLIGAPNPVRRLADKVSRRLAPMASFMRLQRRDIAEAFRRLVAERGIQLIEMEETFGWAWWVKEATSVPICVRLHGPWFLNGRALGVAEDDAFRSRIADEGRAIASADLVTSPSQDTLDQTREYYKLDLPNAVVFPAPLNPAPASDRWRLDSCDPKLIGYIGRFDRHKGADLLIDAFARVLREVPDAKLRCIGAEKELIDDSGKGWKPTDYIRDRIPGALESGAVQFLGHQPKDVLRRLRREALVTVAPSRYEIFGYTVTEAMSLGCPIIGARTGGIKGSLQDGINGLLHEPGSVDDLTRKILTLLNDPGYAARLGSRAQVDSDQRFAPDRIAAQSIELYRSVLKGRIA